MGFLNKKQKNVEFEGTKYAKELHEEQIIENF